MVCLPEEYPWSSYSGNAQGCMNELVTPHGIYLKLGQMRVERFAAYTALFKIYLDKDVIGKIRKSCQTGTPLGNDYFKAKIEQKLERKVGQARRGRPSKGI